MAMPRSPRSPRSPATSPFATAQQHLPVQSPRRPSSSPRSASSPTLPTFKTLNLRSDPASSSSTRTHTNPNHVPHPMSPLSNTGASSQTQPSPARPPLLKRRTTTAGLLLPSARAGCSRPGSPSELAVSPPTSRGQPGSRRASLTMSVCSSVSSTGGSNGRAGGGGPIPPSLLREGRWLAPSRGSTDTDGLDPKVRGWRTDVAAHHTQLGSPSFSSRISPPPPTPTRPSPVRSFSVLSRNRSAGSSSSSTGSRLSVNVMIPPEADVYGYHLLPSPGAPTENVWRAQGRDQGELGRREACSSIGVCTGGEEHETSG